MNTASDIARNVARDSLDESVGDLVTIIRSRATRILVVGIAVGAALVWHGARKPAIYTAVAGFIVETPPTAASGAPLPMGISLRADPLSSPFLYTQLLASNGFLMRVVDAPLRIRNADTVTWMSLAAGPTERIELRRQLAAESLRRSLDYRVSPQSGVVTVSVRAGDPAIAGAAIRALLDEMAEFGAEVRRERARFDLQGIEQRLSQAGTDLRNAETRLVDFRLRNREVAKSATLTMARERLDREMGLKRQHYLRIREEYEDTKAEATKNNPGVIVVNDVVAAATPEPRGLWRRLLMGFIAGAGLAAILTLALDRRAGPAARIVSAN